MLEWKIFVAGCVGAMAPEIARLYRLRQSGLGRIRYLGRYIVVSIVFVLLGGTVAVLLEATSLHAAFYMGLSLPAIVSTAVGKSRSRRAPPSAEIERAADETRPRMDLRTYFGGLFPNE
jgi:uncharacterized membrane protein YfcA